MGLSLGGAANAELSDENKIISIHNILQCKECMTVELVENRIKFLEELKDLDLSQAVSPFTSEPLFTKIDVETKIQSLKYILSVID